MKKFFIIISILGFALLTAAELYVQSDSFALRIRPLVVDRLKAVIGSDVEIGWVRANLIPMYIEARDMSLPDERGKTIAAVRKIKVYINPLQLILKKIRLSSIVILEPRLFVERTKDGTLNSTPIIERIKTNIDRLRSGGQSDFKIDLRTVTVIEGKISFDDSSTSTHVEASRIQMSASTNLSGESIKFALKNSEIRVTTPANPVYSGSLRAALWYEHGRFRLDSSELSTADTAISLTGEIGAPPASALNLRLKIKSGPQTLKEVSSFLKLAKKEEGPHIEASMAILGSIAKPSVEGEIKFVGISYQGMQLRDASLSFGYANQSLTLAGKKWKLVHGKNSVVVDNISAAFGYSDHGLDIRGLDILAGDLSLKIVGRADPQHGFDAKLTAESIDKGRTISFLTAVPLEGRIGVTGYLTGSFNAPLFDGNVSAGPLAVRGILFDTADGRLQYRDKKISIVSADIHQRSSRYICDGSADFSGTDTLFSARAKVIRSDVASIVALFYKPIPLKLSATGELSFTGTTRDFTGSARVSVDSGSAYGEFLTRGTVVASLTRGKIAFPQVQVEKGSGTVKGTGWIGFDGTYSANVESSGVKLSEVEHLAGVPVDGRFALEIESSGSFAHPKVSASLGMDGFQYNQTDLGSLTTELKIDGGVLACRAQLADNRAGLSARLGLSKPYGWSLQATVNSAAIDPFVAFGKKDLAGSTRLIAEGSLSARGNGTDLAALSGAATFRRLGFVVGDYRIDNDGDAAFTVRGGRLTIGSLILKGPSTKISVNGSTGFMKNLDFSLTGTAHLSLLRILFREVEHGDGVAEMRLAVRDTWKKPEVTGELQIKNGEIKIKDIPQKFSALNGKLTFAQNRIVADTLTGNAGGGALSASGWAQFAGPALRDFSFKTSFENVTVRYPEGLTSTLSGDLYYDGGASEQSLTGDVTIKRAKYDRRVEWKSMLVDIGKGLYQKKKTEIAWIGDTQINIRFHGTDNILLQNNLAKLALDVDVFLRGTVNQPQLLGRIEARKGTVYFRTNEFNILHASADFVDPNRMNPVLDIQAEIQVRDYRVRLAVSGTADRAVVTLLSDPSLPDSDIISLLALGKTGTELKGKESGVGMSEAASFATGQFQDIFESRARSLTGLDRFQVDPYISKSDTSVPRVTMGKEIVQNKLYVTYSSNVGSATPEQIYRIEYILDKHFSLVGERTEIGNTGADVKYRFEFK